MYIRARLCSQRDLRIPTNDFSVNLFIQVTVDRYSSAFDSRDVWQLPGSSHLSLLFFQEIYVMQPLQRVRR